MTQKELTIAALAAAMAGDMENLLIAATPGGIEAQERQGQRTFVQSSKLPKKCIGCAWEQIERVGVVRGDDVDDLFVRVQLPAGWRVEPTEHSMWSKLLDERGRERASMFYKAAFHDRAAHISLSRYVRVTRRYYDAERETDAAVVTADGAVPFETPRVPQDHFGEIDQIEAAAQAWIGFNYPDHENPLAYWA